MSNFGPVITAMVTPFTPSGDLDIPRAITLAGHLFDTGSTAVLLAGTTGESPTLTHTEEFTLFQSVKQALGANRHIMAGAGSNCTHTACKACLKAHEAGVDSVLQVVPYYNKPSQEGITAHFTHIAKESALPIMLYNIPGRTGSDMSVATTTQLAQLPNIVAIKEASGTVERIKTLVHHLPSRCAIYSGDDALTLASIQAGAVGVVSVAAHLVGDAIATLIAHARAGHHRDAQAIHTQLAPLFDVLFITTNPVPIKTALDLLAMSCGSVRLPLVPATKTERTRIQTVLAALALD